jgi:site-specific DNA-methyltransferase (adenine-specific)
MIELNKIHQGDCLERLKEVDDNSIDLVVIDPPYNIGKDTWDKIDNYEEWMKDVFIELQRVLKDNGSLYWWHNDMTTISKLMNTLESDTNFKFKQMIVWNKRFDGSHRKGFLNGFIEVEKLRNYQKMAEYCLYYTFQDDTGLSQVYADTDNFKELREYLKQEKKKSGLTNKDFNLRFSEFTNKEGCRDRSVVEHYFGNNQWVFPTKEIYENILQKTGYFQRPYNELQKRFIQYRREYDGLVEGFESQRYTYNNQKTHHSVWNYDIDKKIGHVTPKPLEMIKNIIKHRKRLPKRKPLIL